MKARSPDHHLLFDKMAASHNNNHNHYQQQQPSSLLSNPADLVASSEGRSAWSRLGRSPTMDACMSTTKLDLVGRDKRGASFFGDARRNLSRQMSQVCLDIKDIQFLNNYEIYISVCLATI